ncbi:MAG: glycosyltransferase family 9 protein [Synergistaceae bacterium]|jgi:ADP-heptose:LPS heptosyltransferase|nr:glycosyltransferase family 9 protein [Synergistaceae bacterium]
MKPIAYAPRRGDRVLWIRFWAFGDVLEAAADACNFKRRFPDVHLAFMTNPEYAGLLKLQPYVDEVLPGRKKPLAEWAAALGAVRAGRYDWLVSDAHKGGRTALLAWLGRVPRRVGVSTVFPFSWCYNVEPEDWFRGLGLDLSDRSAPSIFPSSDDAEAGRAALSRLPSPRVLALIGAGNADKMWPAERWIELCGALADRGWSIVLNGHGGLEEAMGRRIESAVDRGGCLLNLVGRLDFAAMSGVARACDMALGNDTGPLHLAALSGVPTMGLFSRSTSLSMGLAMPWFRELCAEDICGSGCRLPIKELPSGAVLQAFESFAEEMRQFPLCSSGRTSA